MRDDPPRVGRPRKGTQRKPKERPERFKSATFQLDDDQDLQIPSDSRGNRRISSPINVLTSPTSISSTAISIDSASSDINMYDENDINLAGQDALCAFCNCGSEMAQILGQLSRYYPSPDFDPFKLEEEAKPSHSKDPYAERSKDQAEELTTAPLRKEKRSVGRPPGKKKKGGKLPLIRQQHLTADMSMFGAANRPEISEVFDADGCLWAHHCCAAWSAGVCQTDSYDLENVDKAAFKAISEQCCHCRRHGASVECQIQKCSKLYHYPCCASAGAFQDIKSMVLLCPDHLDSAMRLAGPEATCVLCDKTGDIAKQLFCTSCGRHYHGKCLDPPVAISAIVRMGWQCPECKVCQGCRQPGDDEKMLFCDECDKGFHTYCLSPPMSSVPKTAWKCYRCRKCEDCGSNVPGTGPSCRWHFNYTVCDRCYQQRKKNTLQCCPMCGKTVKSFSGDQNKQCVKCTKLIHFKCDKEIGNELGEYFCPSCRKDSQDVDPEFSGFIDTKEESNDSLLMSPVHSSTSNLDAEYLGQRTVTIAEAEAISRTATGFLHREPSPLLKHNEMEDLDLKEMDINFDEVMMESGLHGPLMHDLDDLKPESSDSFSSPPHISSSASYSHQFSSPDDRHHLSRVSSSVPARAVRGKKKMSPFRCRGRPPGSGRGKKNKTQGQGPRPGRPRSKSTTTSGPNKENIQITSTENNKKEDADEDAEGLHSTVIMVSTKDKFSLGQDICMCCGSFGIGSEGHLIACAHCGQCFHPYCVNIKINKVLMTKGWRCLDCTVCEGCGKNEDEGKLLLCDGCDISYHIYCLDPPLEHVPPDGWKCQWCVECVSCGATTPGTGCKWMASYTQCGPCASEAACCVCNKTYLDDELVIKCTHCLRWLHADCDGLATEDDSELAASYGYHCRLCREKTGHFGIFSSSWTQRIEKSIYTSTSKLTNTQTMIVTQTTTTVLATSVSNRKSKLLGSGKPNRSPLMKLDSRLPLHPVQTSVQGTFEVRLPGLKMKARREDIIEHDSVSLTEKGLRQIKSMIVKAPVRSQSRIRDRPRQSSSDVRLGERETKTSGQLTKTTACSEDIGESRQPVCLASGSAEQEDNQAESENENRPVQEKRPPGRPPGDKKADAMKWPKLSDKRDDPIDFFGTSLLKISRKKRKKDPQTENDSQSSDYESSKQEEIKGPVEQPPNQAGQLSTAASYPEDEISQQHCASTTSNQHGSWPSRIPTGMAVDPLSDEMQHSDSLYKTLNMLVSGPEDAEHQPGRDLHHDRHESQKRQQHYAPSKQPQSRHAPQNTLNEHSTNIGQNPDLTPTGDLDLIGLSDLPHVEGHEVEEIFAGIEREMSVDGTPQSQDQSPMEGSLTEYPKSESSSFSRELKTGDSKPSKFQVSHPSVTKSADPALTPGYADHPQHQRVQLSQPEYRQYDMYRSNPSFQPPFDQRVGQPKPLGAHAGETDAFKAVFGEEPEIKSKSRDDASSPKIDGQKQLRKWEQDEKLGDLATISPVLYANTMHQKLKIEYPEWPNRARAIARLWRKLPQEQREPFRLRARDNRVKQKDQGRKLGTFKKPLSTPTTDASLSFASASPSLSSDNGDKMNPQSTAETTAIDVLSSSLMLNGESSNSAMMRTPNYQQNMPGHSFSESSPGYSHDSSHSFTHGDNSVFRQTQGHFLTGSGDDHMRDPMLMQTRTSSAVSPSIASLHKSQQGLPGSGGKMQSESNKSFSISDLCSPTTPSDLHFPATGLTPTTPVFPTSPFQSSPYGTEATASPSGFISQSLPTEGNPSEKKRSKKQVKSLKEQIEIDKEKKKKKLAIEQEKERQWKVLQQQRLREQHIHNQTPAIQQVLMMKEQMRKENNKPQRKSQINLPLDNSGRSAVLPPVEPFTLAPAKNMQDKSRKSTSITHPVAGLVPSSSNVSLPSKDVLHAISDTSTSLPSSFAGPIDYFKDDIQIPSDQASLDKALFLTSPSSKNSDIPGQMGEKITDAIHPPSALDRLLEIGNAGFSKMAKDAPSHDTDSQNNVNRDQHQSVLSTNSSTAQTWPTSNDISKFISSPSFPMQAPSEEQSQFAMTTTKDNNTELPSSKERTPVISTINSSLSMTHAQQPSLSDLTNQSESQVLSAGKNDQPVKPGFSLASAPENLSMAAAIVPDGLDKPAGLEQQQQQQALLFQQQQFMAAQQQYIQWQLQQRNPELFQSVSTPMQYSSYTDKDLPEVDSEEQHQERIRFLYRQRQMQKQQVVQIQQQLQQQQLIAQQQIAQGSTSTPVRPQIDVAQQQLMQQLLQQQQQTPDAMQQQFLLEYNRQMQQRAEAGQNTMQYDKFIAELAQQYGYSMQQPQSNTHNVPVVQHGPTWPANATQGMHPSAQQMFGYGMDEEKVKDLNPQQIYQLQLQRTLMMHQMAASGIYPSQPTSRNQSPIPPGSRKTSTGSTQDRSKKTKDVKKGVSVEKSTKLDSSAKAQDVPKLSTPAPQELIQARNPKDGEGAQLELKTPTPQNPNLNDSDIAEIVPSAAKLSVIKSPVLNPSHNETPLVVGVKASSGNTPTTLTRTIEETTDRFNKINDNSANVHDKYVRDSVINKGVVSSEIKLNAFSNIPKGMQDTVTNEISSSSKGNANFNLHRTDVIVNASNRADDLISSDPKRQNDVSKTFNAVSTETKVICNDGVHCGTDSEDEGSNGRPGFVEKKPSGVGEIAALKKAVCSDGIHCGTDSEGENDDRSGMKPETETMVCSDGVHCGTDLEDNGSNEKPFPSVCSDGIHCGTDDEEETLFVASKPREQKPCTDGIHCGTDSEDETQSMSDKLKKPKRCNDGIHCGTDSEEESNFVTSKVKQAKHCPDGIHCGTDSEDETQTTSSKSRKPKQCNDGIHCGTDSEDETQTTSSKSRKPKQCNDGIHCGTDSEDETQATSSKSRKPKQCNDGIHCGTDSEDESQQISSKQREQLPCTDGIHCGTDSEGENNCVPSNPQKPCTDGIHCGTDSENEDDSSIAKNQVSNKYPEAAALGKNVCSDGIHCGTDSEDENDVTKSGQAHLKKSTNKASAQFGKQKCSDGIHCGTDSENEESNQGSFEGKNSKNLPNTNSDTKLITSQGKSVGSTLPAQKLSNSISSGSLFSPDHTLEVIQEGDTNSYNSMQSINIGLKDSKHAEHLQGHMQGNFGLSTSNLPTIPSMQPAGMKSEHKTIPTCIYDSPNAVTASQHKSQIQGRQLSQPQTFQDASFSLTSSFAKSLQTSHGLQNETLQTASITKTTTIMTSSGMQEPSQKSAPHQSMQPQIFSPNPSTSVAIPQHVDAQSQARQRSKFPGIPLSSPQYQQVFLHHHQLLIMQFQQYQYQLQARFQQLSQQQMSPQQQFLLQQQYHQQIVLLQRQFVQQQAELQGMASAGMQFTEQELNAMYQQQMVAQQAYNHWIATLSLDQQGQLHARMQANMQQVQQAMSALVQNATKNASEPSKDKSRKARGRRPRKPKTEPSDPATPAPNTPSLPRTPASGGDPILPSTPKNDQASSQDQVSRNPIPQHIYPTAATSNQSMPDTQQLLASNAMSQESNVPPNAQASKSQRRISEGSQGYESGRAHGVPSYNQPQGSMDQQLMQMQGREWQHTGNNTRHLVQQQQSGITMQQQNQKLPRVDIVPEGSNPFSDVYQEMEKKSKAPNQLSTPQSDPTTAPAHGGHYSQDPWKSMPVDETRQTGSGNSTPRLASTPMHSGSAFYYPSPTGKPPSIPPQPNQPMTYASKSRIHGPGMLPQGDPNSLRLYNGQLASKHSFDNAQSQYFDPSREHLGHEPKDSPMQGVSDVTPIQGDQLTNVGQYSSQSSAITHHNTLPSYNSHVAMGHNQAPNMENIQSNQWNVSVANTEQSYSHASQPKQLLASDMRSADSMQQQQQEVQPSPGHERLSGLPNDQLMPPPRYDNAVKSPSSYPVNLSQPSQIGKPESEQTLTNPSQSNALGHLQAKEQEKAMQKKKKGGQPTQLQSTSVDFSLLNSEEKEKFILERKREDFERRQRLVEEQKQLRIKEQRNFKAGSRKLEKKVPRPKQRKLKGGREKLPTEKSPVPSRLVFDDKSLKFPLCEPEVHLLYPLVQPYGSGFSNGETTLYGVFGNALVHGRGDYYAQFPSPDPPVTSSNPPTPPASLPPSPGTINQSLRESLQMIPTEGIFDDLAMTKRPKDDLTLFGSDTEHRNAFYSPTRHHSASSNPQSKDSKDDVMVTLTMSSNDKRTPNDLVLNVTDILGVTNPAQIQVVDEKGLASNRVESSELVSPKPWPLATSIGKETDVHFSCLESKRPSNDRDKNKAPFCKHCDISIQGMGYTECKDGFAPADSIAIKIENRTYRKIATNAGRELFDVFCSQLCLRSYHSLSKPNSESADSGRFIDPVRSVIPVSCGDPSDSDPSRTIAEDVEMRGDQQAEGLPPRITRRRSLNSDHDERTTKRPRSVIWKRWRITFSPKLSKKDSVQTSVVKLLEKYGAALKVEKDEKDNRECMLCGDKGDGVTEGTARLINYDVDVWVHLNCALWSLEVYETLNGALHNVQKAYERGIHTTCAYCNRKGATVTCARVIGSQMRRCEMNYHFNCAIKAHCTFFKDKTVLCPQHKNYGAVDQRLPSYAVLRKVYVNRDITRQLASVLRLNNEKEQRAYTIRVGSLIFHELGQLLPHQLQKFHTKEAIYPVGFQTTRIYWSTSRLGRRCRYLCTVSELDKNPHFTVSVEDGESKVGNYAGRTPREVWNYIIEPIRKFREDSKMVKIFPAFVTGEDMFGLTDPSLQRIIESLPGVDTLHDYSFRFGRTPIIMAELPLAVNPTGCIRSESTRHVHLNRPVSLRTASSAPSERGDRTDSSAEDNFGSMLRNNWAMTKTAQYRKLKSDWKNIVLLSKSRIQGLGLFATRDIDANTMIIEYIGSIIRNEVANKRERIYEDGNRGVYMFRVDPETVIDATMTGGPARYINHSCDPNCVAEVVVIEKMPKIIIISNRKIDQGEELTYDYKFEFEDDQHKIACLCGAVNCRKWMN